MKINLSRFKKNNNNNLFIKCKYLLVDRVALLCYWRFYIEGKWRKLEKHIYLIYVLIKFTIIMFTFEWTWINFACITIYEMYKINLLQRKSF